MYQLIQGSTSVKNLPTGMVFPMPPVESFGYDYQAWLDAGNTPQPAPETPIELRRASRWEQVKAERRRRQDGGVQVSGHWFQTDTESRIQLLRLDQKASNTLAAGGQSTDMLTVAGQPIYWKSTDNGLVPMTVALAQGIATAIEVLDAMAFARGEQLRAQIEASSNPEAIDISTGWPPIFGV